MTTSATTRTQSFITRAQVYTVVKYTTLIIIAIVMFSPVVATVMGSIRTTGEFLAEPFGLPRSGIHTENYTRIFEDPNFWKYMWNSVVITAGITIINVALGSLLAYLFSRMRFTGRGLLFNVFTLGLLFPLNVAILPIFIQIRQLGLMSSPWAVILPMVTFGLPGSVVILRGFFIAIPTEIEDAAYIDGASTFGFFRRILLPMARPALVAVATLQVVAGWNEYFLPLLVLQDSNTWPLPLGLMQYQGQYGTEWAPLMAYVTLLIIPAVAFYFLAERYIVTGLTGGELKG